MTSQITVHNLAVLEQEQRWLDLLDAAKRFTNYGNDQQAFGHYYQGIAYHELKQQSNAMMSFDKAISLDSSNALFYNAKGLLLRDQRNYEKAIEQFELAADRKPEILNPIVNKAQALSLLNRNEEAIVIYNKMLQQYPGYIPAMIFKAESLKELNRYEEALKVYDDAIAQEPNAADLVFNKGNIYANQNKMEAALDCYNKAVKLDPQFPDAYYHIGLVNQRLGRYQDALTNFERAIERESPTPMARIALADLHHQFGDETKAMQIMNDAVERYPNSPFAHYNRGVFKLGQGQIDESSRDFVNAIQNLDEPEVAKGQIFRYSADNERELNRVNQSLSQRAAGSQSITVNFPSLVDGLLVKKENQADIGNNIKVIKERIYSLESSAEGRRKLDAELVALQQSNPQLYEYVLTLLRLERNYLYNTNFGIPKASYALTSVNFLRGGRELPALDSYSAGDRAVELITKSTGSNMSTAEFLERARASLIANRNGFDPEETHFQIAEHILNKVHTSDSKAIQIKAYSQDPRQGQFINSILDRYPTLKSDVSSPAVAVALRDFVLMNSNLVNNSSVSDYSRRLYEKNFETVYNSGAYENLSENNLQGGAIDNFQSFSKINVSRNIFVTIKLQNSHGAVSGSKFYIATLLSYKGVVKTTIPLKSVEFPDVYVSPAQTLTNELEFEFEIPDALIRRDAFPNTYMRILVLKQKPDREQKKKFEEWIALSALTNQPRKIGSFKQRKNFSSKLIDVLITGIIPKA